jgi:hypothetical protein
VDWFERLTGFRETDYATTKARLEVIGDRLRSRVNGLSYGIGTFELTSLRTLRERVTRSSALAGKLQLGTASGDVRSLHQRLEFQGALFQVASQFNMLEMVSPGVTPEMGVTRYEHDPTQGPGCAVAAGAATIYRNYFVPVGDGYGQTGERQLDGLAAVGVALREALGMPVDALWSMRNGYALGSGPGLEAIAAHLRSLGPQQMDDLRGELAIGIHRDVEVTDSPAERRPKVSHAFCSALPVAYTSVPAAVWAPFATLLLEAAYEATMWAGVIHARQGGSNIVLLTRLGGGAFGNDDAWIDGAMRRALRQVSGFGLDVRIVSHRGPVPSTLRLIEEFR